MSFSSSPTFSCAAKRFPMATSARLKSFMASMAASIQATDWRLNSTCSRTCQSSTRATRRFHACTSEFATPPERGFTVPMAATLPSAVSRACASGIRSGKAISTPPAAVSGLRARTRSRTSCSSAISSTLSTGRPPGRTPRGGDQRAQAPARREIADHGGAHRLGCRHYILQHPVDHVLLKLSLIHISEPTRLGMISYAVFCRYLHLSIRRQRQMCIRDRREIADHGGAHRLGCRHYILQHPVDHVLLKDPQIAIRQQVCLLYTSPSPRD